MTGQSSQAYRLCAIIPTYNNAKTIESVVTAVGRHLSDILVVDDGSDAETKRALKRIEARNDARILYRARNGGKGAAVKDGLRWARTHQFTHAVSLDADGQHETNDIPRFVAASQKSPHAAILGKPVFDDSAPRSRLQARKISIFWANVETRGSVIADPLCGFRLYPILRCPDGDTRGNYMDFDPEIAVRLVWNQVPIHNLETHVRYFRSDEGGISHFRVIRDNLRISWMHTRLMLELIFRYRGKIPHPSFGDEKESDACPATG